LISVTGELLEFVPVEVQSMDTTGSYQPEWYRLFGRTLPEGRFKKGSNINWENVNKRIIPQLMSKGNVFRREEL
jgi:Restriction endonuclease NotI